MTQNNNWLLDKILEAASVLSAHDERIKSLESDRDGRSSFFRNGAPLWLSVIISAAALVVALAHSK